MKLEQYKAYFQDSFTTLYNHDCRSMYELPDNSIQCCVTSPPYWGLRKYAGNQDLVWDGKLECQHEWGELIPSAGYRSNDNSPGELQNRGTEERTNRRSQYCRTCGAWRGALGLEPSPELYVQHIVGICREIKRVLRPDGVFWLNVGDSYAGSPAGNKTINKFPFDNGKPRGCYQLENYERNQPKQYGKSLKPKDLCLIPERLALALQQDGWWVRSRIAWVKPNPMPESVTDRPTDSWEHIWMLTKSARYYYDSFAVREKSIDTVREKMVSLEYENMQQVQQELATDGFSQGTESKVETQDRVQGVREGTDLCLEGNGSRSYQNTGNRREVSAIPQGNTKTVSAISCWEGNPKAVSTVSKGQGTGREVSADCQAENSSGQVQQHPKGQGNQQAIPSHRQGKGEPRQRCPQEADEDKRRINSDCIRVAGNQNKVQEPLRLLQTEVTTDNGTLNTPEQGRDSHEKECGASLQELQCPQRQQAQPTPTFRNLRSAWTFPTQSFSGAHFATFPPELPMRCIKASTSEKGCCPKCGKPWERIVDHKNMEIKRTDWGDNAGNRTASSGTMISPPETKTLGWRPGCECGLPPIPCTVLDPFAGSGTTLWVAKKLGRRSVGYELSTEYCELAMKRNQQGGLL